MTIEDLIEEGQKLQTAKMTTAKDKTRYHTWTNNCITYLEQIKFSKERRNLFINYALSHRFEPMMGMLLSIMESEGSHLVEVLEGPIKTGRAVLSTRKYY